MRPGLALYALWLITTAAWWNLALGPIPVWLERTRQVCFGSEPGGLPSGAGWLSLAGPLPMLLALLVVFGPELRVSRHRGLLVGLPVLGLLLVGQRLADAWPRPSPPVDPGALPAAYPRTERLLPDFSLTDQEGRTVRAADLAGEPVLLTFAYAHCGTVCPGLIATLRAVRSPARRVVVTLDPWRDTCGSLPDLARQWQLPAGSLALSGEVEEVAALTGALDVPVLRDERTGEIEHPAVVFVLDRSGRIVYTFLNPSARWLEEALGRE